MPWFKVDDDLHGHRKARKAGTNAMGLWVMCGSWVAKNLTDGWVPEWVAKDQGGKHWKRAADKLVQVGLWTPGNQDHGHFQGVSWGDVTALLGPGFHMHQYLGYNPSREYVLAEREAAAARQARKRARTKSAMSRRDTSARHGVTPDIDQGMRHALPVPVRPYGTSRDGGETTNGPAVDPRTHDPLFNPGTPKTPGDRDPDVEALLAETRAKLRPGRPLRNAPPMDPNPRGGA